MRDRKRAVPSTGDVHHVFSHRRAVTEKGRLLWIERPRHQGSLPDEQQLTGGDCHVGGGGKQLLARSERVDGGDHHPVAVCAHRRTRKVQEPAPRKPVREPLARGPVGHFGRRSRLASSIRYDVNGRVVSRSKEDLSIVTPRSPFSVGRGANRSGWTTCGVYFSQFSVAAEKRGKTAVRRPERETGPFGPRQGPCREIADPTHPQHPAAICVGGGEGDL